MNAQDVSLLVDVCRQGIVFDDLQNLTQCVLAVRDDPDVEVVRFKNRLDPTFNSAQSAGFRNVSINLRIRNQQTEAFGVETHVCELQLSLRKISELAVR